MSDVRQCVCGSNSEVRETRSSPPFVRRTRECVSCKIKWTTVEAPAELVAKIVEAMGVLDTIKDTLLSLPTVQEFTGSSISPRAFKARFKKPRQRAAARLIAAQKAGQP